MTAGYWTIYEKIHRKGEKKCRTKLQPDEKNAYLFELVERAEKWLHENDQWMKEHSAIIPVLKWKTEIWGEIPADYGRK